MRCYGKQWLKLTIIENLRRNARRAVFDGRPTAQNALYLDICTAFHLPTGSIVILTRDAGMHSSGWWKNPDYERCWHLSLSFRDARTAEHLPRDPKATRDWLDVVFGNDKRLLWTEPPYSAEGKADDTWHYRLFCAPNWTPILPRGEVYTREFTEAGWKSFSDVQAELAAAEARLKEVHS